MITHKTKLRCHLSPHRGFDASHVCGKKFASFQRTEKPVGPDVISDRSEWTSEVLTTLATAATTLWSVGAASAESVETYTYPLPSLHCLWQQGNSNSSRESRHQYIHCHLSTVSGSRATPIAAERVDINISTAVSGSRAAPIAAERVDINISTAISPLSLQGNSNSSRDSRHQYIHCHLPTVSGRPEGRGGSWQGRGLGVGR